MFPSAAESREHLSAPELQAVDAVMGCSIGEDGSV